MKKLLLIVVAICTVAVSEAKQLIAYFSATGTTQGVAEEIQRLTGADIYRIEPSEPYAENPYNDSDRIQNEAYNDLRPGVANLPESLDDYDVIFVGSPIWWHYPAMVVCTFLESYDLSGKTVVPFFTYAATTYFQQAVDKILEVTPNSTHLTAFGSTGSVRNVESWLEEIGQLGGTDGIVGLNGNDAKIDIDGNTVMVNATNGSTVNVYTSTGRLLNSFNGDGSHRISLPSHAVYFVTISDNRTGKRTTNKIIL